MCLSRDTVLSDCQIATQRFVHALFTAEFDSVKFDGCSAQHNMTLWAELLNKTGRPAIVENCHVTSVPARPVDEGGCPDFHLYRCVAATTIRPSGIRGLHSLTQLTCVIVLAMLWRRRTSTDIRNTYGSFMENAQTVAPFAATNRTGPGCWAYVRSDSQHTLAFLCRALHSIARPQGSCRHG